MVTLPLVWLPCLLHGLHSYKIYINVCKESFAHVEELHVRVKREDMPSFDDARLRQLGPPGPSPAPGQRAGDPPEKRKPTKPPLTEVKCLFSELC